MATLSGKWQWASIPSGFSTLGALTVSGSFTSNGVTYSSIAIVYTGTQSDIAIVYGDDDTVYTTADGWISSAYRTVDFGSDGVSASDDFCSYFTSNATRQAVTYTVSYYTRKQYNSGETIAYTEPELVGTQTYEEGETITPLAYPTEEGYTPTGWVY